MADKILLKRSLTSGSVPTTASLLPGEIALNVYDGTAYMLKSGSTVEVVQLGTGGGGGSTNVSAYLSSSWTGSTTSQFSGTSSFATTANTSSYSLFALTASYALNGGGGGGGVQDRIASGTATASISQTNGLRVNTNVTVTGSLNVSGNFNQPQLISTADTIFFTGSFYQTGSIDFTGSAGFNGNLIGDTASISILTGSNFLSTTARVNNILTVNGKLANGLLTIANGNFSHAEGSGSTSQGIGSHSEGQNTTAVGNYSHAEGLNSKAIGLASHAEGSNTTAVGFYTFTQGMGTISSKDAGQVVLGRYNQEVSGALFILGGGTNFITQSNIIEASTGSIKLNAFNISLSGSTTITGSLTADLIGTSSYALTASYAENVPETASFAVTASYALTASYADNVPETASYALLAETASYALTSSYASNVPETASYAIVAETASYAEISTSSSFAETASFLLGSISSASYAETASYAEIADLAINYVTTSFVSQQLVGKPVFSDGTNQFNWVSSVNGNPTTIFNGSATLGSYSSFVTTNNYDGVILTPDTTNRSGSVYWSGSRHISVEDGPVWVSFAIKGFASNVAELGWYFHLNSELTLPRNSAANEIANGTGITIFNDQYNGGGATADVIRVYNNNNTLIKEFGVIDGTTTSNIWNKWDLLFYKEGLNYFVNIYQSRGVSTIIPSKFDMPVLLPFNTSNANTDNAAINLGTTWPTGSIFGFSGRTASSRSVINWVNSLQIRSGYLLPGIFQTSFTPSGFS
jgi:hypothetical protein